MLYQFLKIVVRVALKIFCRKIYVSRPRLLRQKGPLLLAVNHPNSFLDAIIIGSLFKQPVYFLARGDAFGKPWIKKLLLTFKTIPIYRLSEGKENLGRNEITFQLCREIFRRNGIVLIFSEGICENEWQLRPLKKGTARLAISAWADEKIGAKLKVQPVGINYNSFHRFGKVLLVNLGNLIRQDDFKEINGAGDTIRLFNEKLQGELGALVLQGDDDPVSGELSGIPAFRSFFLVLITLLPATIGLFINFPFYALIKSIAKNKTAGTVYYDGVLFGLLVLLYPVYTLALALFFLFLTGSPWSWGWFILAPFSAWVLMMFRDHYKRCRH